MNIYLKVKKILNLDSTCQNSFTGQLKEVQNGLCFEDAV